MHWFDTQHRSMKLFTAPWNRDVQILCEMAIAVIVFGLYIILILTRLSSAVAQTDAAADERSYYSEILQSALVRYITDVRQAPGGTIPEGIENALSICKEGVTDYSCLSLDALMPEYIAHIPVNKETNMQKHSGYAVYLDHRMPRVIAGLASSTLPVSQPQDTCAPCPVCMP